MTNFDTALALLILAFGVLGAVSGARAQLKLLMGIYFCVALSPLAVSQATPAVSRYGGVPADSVVLKACLVLIFGGLFFFLGVLAFEKSPLKREIGDKTSAPDRLVGFGIGGAKSAFALYAALCALAILEKPLLLSSSWIMELASGSAALEYSRHHSMFGDDLAPTIVKLAGKALDPAAARVQLKAEMQKALEELTGVPDPTGKNKALAEAIKTGDAAYLRKHPRFSRLMKTAGMNALMNPSAGIDAALGGAKGETAR
jgi:hypothetical protein